MRMIQHPEAARHTPRQYPRVRLPKPCGCTLSTLTPRGWWFRKPVNDIGLVYDLSQHGLCLSTDAAINPGDRITLMLRLAKGTPPTQVAVATVCWKNHQFHGLVFRTLSQSSLGQLIDYMNVSGIGGE
jgi:hypothetical protein